MNQYSAVIEMLIAAMKSAAIEKKITNLQLTLGVGQPGKVTNLVRLVVFPNEQKTKEEAQHRIYNGDIEATGEGEHYTHNGLRVIVVPESFTHNWSPDHPLGKPEPPKGAN